MGSLSSSEASQYFNINEVDAREAIRCAIEVFDGFDVSGNYVFPTLEFLEARSVEE